MKKHMKYMMIIYALITALIASFAITLNFTVISKANANTIEYMNIPQITVLTHGLADFNGASHWSNTCPTTFNESTLQGQKDVYHFAYDADSLIGQIDKKVGGADIYWAKFENDSTYKLYNIGGENVQKYGNDYYESYKNGTLPLGAITDCYRHKIIVFEASNGIATNEAVYAEFEKMLNNAVAQIKAFNPGHKSPKVNLIGHSRGGLTNLQYALDHPQTVASTVSMGTPYFGLAVPEFMAAMAMGNSDGLSDCSNSAKQNEFYEKWLNLPEKSSINAIAIAGQNLGLFSDTCVSVFSQLGRNGSKDYNFTTYARVFELGDGDYNKLSSKAAAAAHNFETRDKTIINYILSSITFFTPEMWGLDFYNYADGHYNISTALELYHLRNLSSTVGINFKLTTDIDLSGFADWEPLPDFYGTLNGAGHSVTGMKIDRPYAALPEADFVLPNTKIKLATTSAAGLFMGNYGTIKDMNVSGDFFIKTDTGTMNVNEQQISIGIICGANFGTISNCTTSRSHVEDAGYSFYYYDVFCVAVYYDIYLIDGAYNSNIGGITGMNWGMIQNCSNSSAIFGGGNMGGIVGYNNGQIISGCKNYGKISYRMFANTSVGGIVGVNQSNGLSDLANYGIMEYINPANSETNIAPAIGQIAGSSAFEGTNLTCGGIVDKGKLTAAQSQYVSSGAIGKITNSYAAYDIKFTSENAENSLGAMQIPLDKVYDDNTIVFFLRNGTLYTDDGSVVTPT